MDDERADYTRCRWLADEPRRPPARFAAAAGSLRLRRAAGCELLCPACLSELPLLAPDRCPQCALPSPHGQRCGACLRDAPHYDATLARWAYDFPIREMVLALKYQARLALAPWLACGTG